MIIPQILSLITFIYPHICNATELSKSNLYHIKMLGGGVTSSGFKSFFTVSNEFRKSYGLFQGLIMTFARIPLKFIQMV